MKLYLTQGEKEMYEAAGLLDGVAYEVYEPLSLSKMSAPVIKFPSGKEKRRERRETERKNK
jgi:hypothetical protein